MTDQPVDTRGLLPKFDVQRTDGDPQGKHADCRYFVLDVTHDADARTALAAYAEACATSRPVLARDLHKLLENLERPAACHKCLGEGRIANSDDGEPWSTWESLPPGSDLAVRLGLVFPIDCPVCGGTGKR